jgi:hypothetical protein
MRFFVRSILILSLSFAFPAFVSADLLTPLAGGNRAPLAAIYGLPTHLGDQPPEAGKLRFTLDNSLASSYFTTQNGTSSLLLDGETWRTGLRFDYSVSDELAIAVTIPFISHNGGFLDSFIEDWHHIFGLPQGGRTDAPRNRILYRYQENGVDQLLLDENARGIGDLQLEVSSSQTAIEATRFHLALKLPTGDPDRLLGSGAPDLSLLAARTHRFDTEYGHFGLSSSLGGSWLGQGDVLPSRQRRGVIFARLCGGWQPYSWLATQLCIDGHSGLYRGTGLKVLDDPALILTGGFSLQPDDDWELELTLSEDLSVGASPDVVFQINVRHSF